MSSQPRDPKTGHFLPKKTTATSTNESKPSKKKSNGSNLKLKNEIASKLKETEQKLTELKKLDQKARQKQTTSANSSPPSSTAATKKSHTTESLTRITITTENKNYSMLLSMKPAAGAPKLDTITDIQKAMDIVMTKAPNIQTLRLESKDSQPDYGLCGKFKDHNFKNDGYATYCVRCGAMKV